MVMTFLRSDKPRDSERLLLESYRTILLPSVLGVIFPPP